MRKATMQRVILLESSPAKRSVSKREIQQKSPTSSKKKNRPTSKKQKEVKPTTPKDRHSTGQRLQTSHTVDSFVAARIAMLQTAQLSHRSQDIPAGGIRLVLPEIPVAKNNNKRPANKRHALLSELPAIKMNVQPAIKRRGWFSWRRRSTVKMGAVDKTPQ
jgi:hypothetical protein